MSNRAAQKTDSRCVVVEVLSVEWQVNIMTVANYLLAGLFYINACLGETEGTSEGTRLSAKFDRLAALV
ncbi:MAG: hypothetical protein ACFB16_16140 [Phormidesmis sp.]